MKAGSKRQSKKRPVDDVDEIDEIVVREADDPSRWEKPVSVRRSVQALELSGDLAARAAFLARAHHAKNVEQWLEHIIRERVELEETAFVHAKRDLSPKDPA